MLFKRYVPFIALCMISLSSANGATMTTSTVSRPVVIELFTSQGCDSCPPAEALLGEYSNNPNVLALAYHVDYWDYLGWHDPFELPISAQRQQGYGRSLKLASLFTPQSIIDGRISLVGSDRSGLMSALHEKHEAIPVSLSRDRNTLTINLSESVPAQQFDISVILYQSFASTPVGRGENAGHTLKEYNIVRSFQRLKPWSGHATNISVPLTTIPNGADRIAILIQNPNEGAIEGAASIPL